MFEIEYCGGNCFTLSTKKTMFVFDPNRKLSGLKELAVKDAVQVATEQGLLAKGGYRLSFCGEGEYEVADTMINGIAAVRQIDDPKDKAKNSTIYSIDATGIKIGVIGNILADSLTDQQFEDLGLIDILILPIGGGGYTVDAVAAAKLISQIEPKIVIPIHYAESGLNYEVPQDNFETLLGELKAPVIEEKKLKIKSANDLPVALEIHRLALEK
jgi:L-ascorbate metabolism protein UlaG (beta-lactamase superfamily)